jgi:uncharacterized protein (DUF1800 family)
MTNSAATAAVNRFGLGAMPGELVQAGDARDWLGAQLRVKPDLTPFVDLPDSLQIIRREAEYRQQRRRARTEAGSKRPGKRADAAAAPAMQANAAVDDIERTPLQQEIRRDAMADLALRYRVAASTSTPFVERLIHFWSNHFAISIDKNSARLLAAPMEREAIRPHVLGNFADLLAAVETHPGMLLYLDNAASIGDDSMLANRVERRDAKRKLGLNENLAREILELHTLGVDGGYAQQDVVELAKAITGWGTPLRRDAQNASPSAFVFRPAAHEPGARIVLGKRYAEGGETQGHAILRDLAVHPATARHLSLKLARHFVADTPPKALVDRMAASFLRSGGSLPALYRAMVDDDAAWSADARKFKTPEDFVVSAMRAGAIQIDRKPLVLIRLLQQLGQPTFTPRSPAGFPDTAADWASGDALRKRLQASGLLAEQLSTARKPVELAVDVLGAEAVEGPLAELLRRVGSPQEGFAVLFSSPAFQWRV